MAKSYGIWARLRRNNRIMKAALSGSLLYALTVAVAAPLFGDAPTSDNSAASYASVATLALRPALINAAEAPQVPSPVTIVRDLVNRPAYQAYLREKNCLTTAIYHEARGESAIGQKAVAEVIIARTRVPGRPRSICGVVYEGSHRKTGCQFSFTCDGISDRVRDWGSWREAQKIAVNVMRTGGKDNPVAGGATFYHADYVSPRWASRMVKVAEIGTHIFYRPPPGRNL
jgi:spore germination cell wall hydrolase CwlJ-like protein